MDRAFFVRPVAVAAALHILAALHGAGPCAAIARPLVGRLPAAAASRSRATATTSTSALAVVPAAADAHQRRAAAGDGDGDDGAYAAREGKWLPFLGGAHHVPAAYWAHKPAAYWAHKPPVAWPGVGASVPELGGGSGAGAGAVEGGEVEEEGEVVRGRERRRRHRDREESSYVGNGESTRQEQLAMWASLLNPKWKGRPATATGWLPAPGIGEAADDEPAKASADTPAVEGAEGEEPSAGRQAYWGNNGN
ncbi:unnamed protein product [Urochloa humidicola]